MTCKECLLKQAVQRNESLSAQVEHLLRRVGELETELDEANEQLFNATQIFIELGILKEVTNA